LNSTLISISGPTAIGKTLFAIELAKKLDTEIISFDSRQFYKEMSIGTAVPTKDELTQVKHHFIQHKSIHDQYTVSDYKNDVDELIKTLSSRKKHILLVGGSNLYLKSIINGLDDIPEVPLEIRNKLNHEFQIHGIKYIQNLLKKLDPEYYNKVDKLNHRRIIRALEVSIFSNKPFSYFLKGKLKKRYNHHSIVLNIDRNILYERINNRVDHMIDHGLINEVKRLNIYKNLNPLNTIGYKEIFKYLNGEIHLEKSIELIKMNTRRFAKKQLTWLKNDGDHLWLDSSNNKLSNIDFLFEKLF
jgi:tRNA dimethylallyltransferase